MIAARALPLLFALTGASSALAEAPALDPAEPSAGCERFVSPLEADDCRALLKKLDLDWYAAAICTRMDEDEAYLACLKKIDGRLAAPAKVSSCLADSLGDAERARCLESGLGANTSSRQPAAKGTPALEAFQPARPTRKNAR